MGYVYEKEEVKDKLLKLMQSKRVYYDVAVRVLKTWREYKDRFKCPKCGSRDVEIKGAYYKCKSCGTMDMVLGVDTSKFQVMPQYLTRLVHIGVMTITYKSRRYTHYAVVDEKAIEEAINSYNEMAERLGIGKRIKIPEGFLSRIVGLESVKRAVIRVLRSRKPVHLLLIGPPASAKSMILEEIREKIPGAYMVLAGASTKVGIRDLIAEYTPRVLLIDELDKINSSRDLSVLLSWMQDNRIIVTMHGRYDIIECPYPDSCKVIAAANSLRNIPREILSRFIRKEIREYSRKELVEVCKEILTKEEDVPEDVAVYIGQVVADKLHSKDPRDCVKIARLMEEKTKEEVDRVLRDMT